MTDGEDGTTQAGVSETEQQSQDSSPGDTVLHRTTPTLRPTLIFIALSLFVGVVSLGYLAVNPETVAGDAQLTELVMIAIAVLLGLILLRLFIRILILRRTQYVIRSDRLERKFTLLMRHRSREVPVRQLRGHEYTQNRIQALLGYGTVRMLTGGTNQSLGFVEFEDIPNPDTVRQHVQRITE